MPHDIAAWAIGVEKYDGAELNISQPVGMWAIEFAELMLHFGVSKIILSLSISEGP